MNKRGKRRLLFLIGLIFLVSIFFVFSAVDEGGFCGDGAVNTVEEECDGGLNCDNALCICLDGYVANPSTNGCVKFSTVNCGDGVLNSGEQCDDGNTISGDGCSSECLSEFDCEGDSCYIDGYLKSSCFSNPESCEPTKDLKSQENCLILDDVNKLGARNNNGNLICEGCGVIKDKESELNLKICNKANALDNGGLVLLDTSSKKDLVRLKGEQVGIIEGKNNLDNLIFDFNTKSKDEFVLDSENKNKYLIGGKLGGEDSFSVSGAISIKNFNNNVKNILNLGLSNKALENKDIFSATGEINVALRYDNVGILFIGKDKEDNVVLKERVYDGGDGYFLKATGFENEGRVFLADGSDKFFKLSKNKIGLIKCSKLDEKSDGRLSGDVCGLKKGDKRIQCRYNSNAYCSIENKCNYIRVISEGNKDGLICREEGRKVTIGDDSPCSCEYYFKDDDDGGKEKGKYPDMVNDYNSLVKFAEAFFGKDKLHEKNRLSEDLEKATRNLRDEIIKTYPGTYKLSHPSGDPNLRLDKIHRIADDTKIDIFLGAGKIVGDNSIYAHLQWVEVDVSASMCGNGVIEEDEECDDGNTANGDGCSSECLFEGPECLDATYVYSTNMWTVGEGCHYTNHIEDSVSVEVPVAGKYLVKGAVFRGKAGDCQPNEAFYLEINGEKATVEDDADPCAIFVDLTDVGLFNFNAGANSVLMHTSSKCPPDTQPGSVGLRKLCLYPEEYYVPQCSDGVDNDGDGLVDYEEDPECSGPNDNSEGELGGGMQCQDEIDNDYDGLCDYNGCVIYGNYYPPDPDCTSVDDTSEVTIPQCADEVDNDYDGKIDMNDPQCDSSTDNNEWSNSPQCGDGYDNDYDGFCDVVTSTCLDGSTPGDPGCFAVYDEEEWNAIPQCGDSIDNDNDGLIDLDDPGCETEDDTNEKDDAYECEDGIDNDNDGNIDMLDEDCLANWDNKERSGRVCNDGFDNDYDGFVDYPSDLGCTSSTDTEEEDEVLPECSDSYDNDEDTKVDYPGDLGCLGLNDYNELDNMPKCNDGFDNDHDGLIDYPNDIGCYSAYDNEETQNMPECSDGYDNDNDGYVDMADAGCTSLSDRDEEDELIAACDDEEDNDGDDFIDYPDDVGCLGTKDYKEEDGLEACNDGFDNDGDGLIDYPSDLGCEDESDKDESDESRVICKVGEKHQCYPVPEEYTYTYHRECSTNRLWSECVPDYDINIVPVPPLGKCIDGDVWPCPRQAGVCQGSYQTCEDGEWPGCEDIYDEIETYEEFMEVSLDDELDNNCDGSIDEEGLCVPGDERECGSAVGQCSFGIQKCSTEGFWEECKFVEEGQEPKPESNVPDSKDNDCDGAIDEGTLCSKNKWNQTKSCGPLTELGLCEKGEQKCSDLFGSGYVWGACVDAVYPSYDICGDEEDNDCDGLIDENCGCDEGDERKCGTDLGECSTGIQKCENGQWSKSCIDDVGPNTEVCLDGLDNDCDGSIDEDCPCDNSGNITRSCPKQEGVCEDSLQLCIDGTWQECDYDDHDNDYEKTEKSCSDEEDNDCDGDIDSSDADCTVTDTDECAGGLADGEYDSQGKCCDEGVLRYYCSKCGCPSGKICSSDGRCVAQTITPTTGSGGGSGGGTSCKDSDSDGLCDDDERVLGTDPYKADTDSDGILDKDDFYPLCNEDGTCGDRENKDNCPDCGKGGFPWWLITLLLILIVTLLFVYWYIQKGKKKNKKKPNIEIKPTTMIKTPEGHSNIKQLYEYVLKSMQGRVSESEIKKMSLDAGWSAKEIDHAIESARKELKRRYALSSLVNYVITSLRKKKKEDEIKKNLIKAGWNGTEIAWAFARARLLVKRGKKKEPTVKVVPVTTKVVEKEVVEKPQYIVIPGKKEAPKKKVIKKTATKKKNVNKTATKKPTTKKTVTKKTTKKKPTSTTTKPKVKTEVIEKVTTEKTTKKTSIHPKTKKTVTKVTKHKPVVKTTKKVAKK